MEENTITTEGSEPLKINVIRESLSVSKELLETGRVLITKKVSAFDQVVDTTSTSEEINIVKVPVNQFVDAVPVIRYEGQTTIIPVLREVLVTEKKLLLVEEIHITKHILTHPSEETISLRHEEVIIEKSSENPTRI